MAVKTNFTFSPNPFYKKFISFLLIMQGSGRPIYADFNIHKLFSPFLSSVIYSSVISALLSYSKLIGAGCPITSIKCKKTKIFFLHDDQTNLIYVFGINRKSININKESYLVKEFYRKLQYFFNNELEFNDWPRLDLNTQIIIKKKIDVISGNLLNKIILKFFF